MSMISKSVFIIQNLDTNEFIATKHITFLAKIIGLTHKGLVYKTDRLPKDYKHFTHKNFVIHIGEEINRGRIPK
jgi:hypothetical protein